MMNFRFYAFGNKSLFLFKCRLVLAVAILCLPLTITFAYGAAKLPVPRFVTLRSNDIVMRAGPGREYPIKWRLHRKGLPVKVIAEYDTWRQVECHDGTKGWIHQSLLSGKRTLLVIDSPQLMWSKSNRDAKPIAKLGAGAIAPTKLKNCTSNRCPVTYKKHKGWVNKSDVWGLLPKE